MKHKILKKSLYNNSLKILGFSKLPFIGIEILNNLIQYYKNEIPNLNVPFFNFILSDDIETKLKHHQFISECISPYFNRILEPYRIVTSSYFIKTKNKNQTVGLHIDPTFVNIFEYDDYIIWIPLVDTNLKKSGRIQLVPFSHITNNKLNLENSKYFSYNTDMKDFCATYINLKAGTPIIFFNNLTHGSEINYVYEYRYAITLKVSVKAAPIASYHIKNWDKKEISIYLQNDELYYIKNRWNEDELPKSGYFYKHTKLNTLD